MKYAQIDKTGRVITINDFDEKLEHPDMILIDDIPNVSIGMIYDREKNSWEEPEPEPEEPEEPQGPTIEERLEQLDQMMMATMSAVVELGLKGGEF